MRKVQLALLLVLLPTILPKIWHGFPNRSEINHVDFDVYYTAAVMAKAHQSLAIYKSVDPKVDPQLVLADPATPFSQTAVSRGIKDVQLYVYPPILADMLVPLAGFSVPTALNLWMLINIAALALTGVFLLKLMDLRWLSLGSLALFAGIFCFPTIIYTVLFGQITIILLLLWVAGIYFYSKGWHMAAGFAFALAASIKLTPLIVLVPLVLWREWKLVQAFTVWLVLLGAFMCVVNTPEAMVLYIFHLMPLMSRGIPNIYNWSLAAAMQRFYVALRDGAIYPVIVMAIPKTLVLFGKVCSLVLLAAATFPVLRLGTAMRKSDRAITLALFAMLSACISPVSWPHAYVVCFAALALLWGDAFREQPSDRKLLVLVACSLALTAYLSTYTAKSYIVRVLQGNMSHAVLVSVILFSVPIGALWLVLANLYGMRAQPTQVSRFEPRAEVSAV